MIQEYSIAKGWAIFIYIFAPLMICLFVFLLLMPWIPALDDGKSANIYWFMAPLSVGMIALMVIGLIDTAKSRFVIEADRVYTTGVSGTRELMLHEIEGYRTDDKYIYIEPSVPGRKRIKISKYFGKSDEIIAWLWEHYPNLDEANAAKEEAEILGDATFGTDEYQRERSLAKARQTARILNWAGGLAAAWTLFRPEPYEYALTAAMLVPLAAPMVLRMHKGLIKVDERKGSAYPSIFWALFLSMMAVCLRAMLDYNLLDYAAPWRYVVPVAVGFLLLVQAASKPFRFGSANDYGVLFFMLCLATAWSWGTVVGLNCMHDTSTSVVYHAQVLDKRISSGKTTTYYLKLSPWGERQEAEEESVPSYLYEQADRGATVDIYGKAGRWGIPWFVVTPGDRGEVVAVEE